MEQIKVLLDIEASCEYNNAIKTDARTSRGLWQTLGVLMLIDLLDKLISRAIDLIKEEQRLKRSLHDNFVAPLMDQFDEVHNNYISTFIKYKKLISEGGSQLIKNHPIFREMIDDKLPMYTGSLELNDNGSLINIIKMDSLESEAMRIKLNTLWDGLESKNNLPEHLMAMLRLIADYVDVSCDTPRPRNIGRDSLIKRLRGCSRDQACVLIDEKIDQMQTKYSEVWRTYQKLKGDLIT